MAFLRKKPRSPYWFLRARDPETGELREESTKLRHDNFEQTRTARRQAEKATHEEARFATADGPRDAAHFSHWVATYIASHYQRGASLRRYQVAWANLCVFLTEHNLRHPRQIRYEHAAEYVAWRLKLGISRNTARLEVKFFAFIMAEAIRREYCERNAIALARVPRAPVVPRPDLDADDLARARAIFVNRPKWMRTVFEIQAHLGCRFSETSIPFAHIDFARGIIHLTDSKRPDDDPRKLYAVPLPESLRPYLLALKESGAERTVHVLSGDDNRCFNIYLKAATGATSHSLRVAFISRCHRAGLSEMQAMRLVNHSSQLVHRIYSRLSVEDMRSAMEKLPAVLPPPPVPAPGSPPRGQPKNPSPSAASSCDQRTGTQGA
jgi:hypothetical protein